MWRLAVKLRREMRMVEFYYLRYLQVTRKNGALRWYGQVE
jgi:hypothetical protein